MSVYTVTSGLLSFKPRVWVDEDRLISRTSLLGQLLRLFAFSKRIVVDRGQKSVIIQRRLFWLIHTKREIPFSQIQRIDYAFDELMTSWNFLSGTTDQLEFFRVSLVVGSIYQEKYVKLWTFWGEGSVMTGWSGWLLGDSLVDMSGKQEAQSRDYVSLLKEYTGKSLT